MTITLYGYPMSTCTRLVALILVEKNVPYKFVPVDLSKGEHKAADYVEKQPFGQVPYIVDDGLIVYESRAISRYLIRKYPNQGTPGLIPTDLKQEALFEQAASVEVSHFAPHVGPFVFEKLIKPRYGGTTDEAKAAESLKALEGKLDIYEGILGKQKYLAGDSVTLADLQHLPYGSALPLCGAAHVFDAAKRPNLARWWNDLVNRPAWQAIQGGAHLRAQAN